jgi:RNA polymerase sigma-70 factor (ECF subfamily)
MNAPTSIAAMAIEIDAAAGEWRLILGGAMTPSSAGLGSGSPAQALQQSDDDGLVRAFRSGAVEAFDVLVERHQRRVYQICYRFTGNREDALDLAQEAFVRAFRGLSRFKGESSVSTWLYRVAVNVCLNKAAARRVPTQPIADAHSDVVDGRSPDPLADAMREETAAAVRRAIRQLPPKQRATLILRVYQDLPHEEIARILGSTEGAAKANFFHALSNLKRLIREP